MNEAFLFIFGGFVTLLALGPLVLAGLIERDDDK